MLFVWIPDPTYLCFPASCPQEYVLSHTEMPSSLQGALEAIKKHEDFMTTMEASEEKINGVVEAGRRLVSDGNVNGDKIQEKGESIQERWRVDFTQKYFIAVYS